MIINKRIIKTTASFFVGWSIPRLLPIPIGFNVVDRRRIEFPPCLKNDENRP